MQLQLILLIAFISIPSTYAVDPSTNQSVTELFRKYEMVMDQKRTEYIDEVFSKRFIQDSGGKTKLVKKILQLPTSLSPKPKLNWSLKKGIKSDLYLAKVSESAQEKSLNEKIDIEFIIIKEDGILKIEGTMNDDH
jgi:hypothetical protein